MLLGLAVVLIGIQMAPTTTPTLMSPATDVTLAARTTEESDSTSSVATRLKVDSIYATDKERQPALVPVEVTQNSQSFSTIRIPEVNEKRHANREVESMPARREWLALGILEHGAAAFDAYSTRQAISRGAAEEDPIMRPFAHSPQFMRRYK